MALTYIITLHYGLKDNTSLISNHQIHTTISELKYDSCRNVTQPQELTVCRHHHNNS